MRGRVSAAVVGAVLAGLVFPGAALANEQIWALLKRGIHGVYHHTSEKHLGRYVDEFTFRLNDGNVKRQTLDRLNSFISATVGRGITYKALIA